MFDSSSTTPTLVFLHIPKTAGQTVHNSLARAIGPTDVSPVRVHTQVSSSADQFPEGYRLYSGHLDWTDLQRVPQPRFVFSVLRDPRERIASFYFYLRNQAEQLSQEQLKLPENAGKKAAIERSADDYFFGGDAAWQQFILDHYDNFYVRYFASRKIRAGEEFSQILRRRKLRLALRNLNQIDWIYHVDKLACLEADLNTLFGFEASFSNTVDNQGDRPRSEPRWARLLEHMEADKNIDTLESFVELDDALMQRLEF